MKKLSLLTFCLFSVSAIADYQLVLKQKKITCFDDDGDNMIFVLNEKRKTVKYTVEGESSGAKKITSSKSDDKSFVVYTTEQGALRLDDNKGDTFQFANTKDADAVAITCK